MEKRFLGVYEGIARPAPGVGIWGVPRFLCLWHPPNYNVSRSPVLVISSCIPIRAGARADCLRHQRHEEAKLVGEWGHRGEEHPPPDL